jgi:hypothetical protein
LKIISFNINWILFSIELNCEVVNCGFNGDVNKQLNWKSFKSFFFEKIFNFWLSSVIDCSSIIEKSCKYPLNWISYVSILVDKTISNKNILKNCSV